MPFNAKRNTRLYIPDIIVMKKDRITHIVEPETGTGGTTIIGKMLLANKCIEIMLKEGTVSQNSKPKLIFLYKDSYPDSKLKRIKERVNAVNIQTEYIGEVIIDNFSDKFDWLDEE
jgi:hypothetical protein